MPAITLSRSTGELAPGQYVLTAWVRRREDRPAPETVTASLDARTVAGDISSSMPVTLRNEYDRIELPLDLAETATSVRVQFGATAETAQCVLIDDVFLTHRP